MKIAVTCIQLIRDLPEWKPVLERAGFEVSVPEIPGQHLAGDALVEAVGGCEGVIAGDDRFTDAVLERLPDLRAISKWGVGVDGIDRSAADARGITVTNTPGAFDDEVADVTMAYTIMLLRQLHTIDQGVRSGSWPKPAGRSASGLRMGVIGLGGIGRAVVRRAVAAHMQVLGADPSDASRAQARELGARPVELEELLRSSDVVSVNCPLTPETHHLLDATTLALMPPGSYVVNTGRGEVVDDHALAEALNAGHLAGAALDVLEQEPPSPDNPLLGIETVIFGSHNASNTLEASARVHRRAIENLAGALGLEIRIP